MTAIERFAELRAREHRNWPHHFATHAERCRIAMAASLLQVIDQATAETAAGASHDIGDLKQLADELIAKNRKGRDPGEDSAEKLAEIVGKMNRNERRRYRRELKKRGIAA